MTKCITYQAPDGRTITLSLVVIEIFQAAGIWPRNASGEYCSVCFGEHDDIPMVLCQSADGWSLHRPGATDEEIASGDAPPLLDGPWITCGHSACRQHWIDTGKGDCIEREACECGGLGLDIFNGNEIQRCDLCKRYDSDTEAAEAVERAIDAVLRPANEIDNEPYVAAACDKYHRDGEIEIDAGALVSRGDDGGAYVQAWVWVSDDEIRPDTNGIDVEESVTAEQLAAKGFADPRQ